MKWNRDVFKMISGRRIFLGLCGKDVTWICVTALQPNCLLTLGNREGIWFTVQGPNVSRLPRKTSVLVLIAGNLEARSFLFIKSINSESHGYFDRGGVLGIKEEWQFSKPFPITTLESKLLQPHFCAVLRTRATSLRDTHAHTLWETCKESNSKLYNGVQVQIVRKCTPPQYLCYSLASDLKKI